FMFDVYSLWQEYEFDPEFKTKVNEILWNEFHLYILKVADNIIEFVRECDYRDCDVQIRSKLYKIDSTKFECPERYIIKTVVTEKDDDPKNVLGFKFTVKQTEYSRDQYMKLCKTQL
ncbi:MAG: hypothetical protein J5614_01455, partial [Paludibacteraceae bacterium]|nr:hypothetical protein [Paludibacteraceae bacterium]